MESRKFEESWKEAFDQAEISPSENVWTNIELDLEKAKARKLKRGLVFYQLLAAASVVFALGIGLGVYVNSSDPSANETLAAKQATPSAQAPAQTPSGTETNHEAADGLSGKTQHNAAGQQPEAGHIAGAASQHNDRSGAQNNDQETKSRNGEEDHNIIAKTNAGSTPETSPNATAQRGAQTDTRKPVEKENTTNGIAQASATEQARGSAPNNQGLAKQQNPAGEAARIAANATGKRNADKPGQQDNLKATEHGFTTASETSSLVTDNAHQGKSALPRAEGAIASSSEKEDAAAAYPPSFERKLPELVAQRKPALILPHQAQADPVALMLAKLERRELEVREHTEKENKKEERSKHENLWTSVGVAAGSFNPVVARAPASSSLQYASSQFASNASKQMKAKGATYSAGVNMGTRLSKRWVLQGGVNYLTQTSDYTQNGLIQNPRDASSLKLPSNFAKNDELMITEGDINTSAVVDTPPYNVNNSVRYLSVPMQAGYMLVNKDFGLQLNAGVSTDLLLQNNITATVDGEVESDYEGSDYRKVNLSGLMGTELSYKFGRRYRLALNPGVRYPFSNIYKSDDFRATRLSFDVGLRFRYIFK